MRNVEFVQHKGKSILYINFSGKKPKETLDTIREAKILIATQPLKSLRTLTDVRDMTFDSEVSNAMKEYAAHNKPYVIAAAVVGITGLKQIIFNAVLKFSGRNLAAFDTVDLAKDWLAQQQ